MEKSWWLFWCCNGWLWWKQWWRWKHLNPWVVIDSTTNSGCWWSVLFLIWSCDIVLIITVTVFIIFIIVMTLMMMTMMMLTWTLVMTTMMMVTCMGLSWTLYSFSSSLPRRPLPFLLTGLKMQSSDLSSRDHVFCLLPFPFFVFFHSFVHLISTLFCHSWAGRSSSLGRILSCPSLCRRRYLLLSLSWSWSISSSSSIVILNEFLMSITIILIFTISVHLGSW